MFARLLAPCTASLIAIVLLAVVPAAPRQSTTDQTDSSPTPAASGTASEAPAQARSTNDAAGPREFRAVWITNVDSDVLTSKEKIAEAMDFLAAAGFNVVFPVVWNKAYTLYPSAVMEREFGRRIDPLYGDRDPLAELILEAHRVGIEVIPWFEYGFAAAYDTGEANRAEGGFLLQQRPRWRALDREGNLVEKNHFEWMNALDPEVQEFLLSLILEVVENYDVDGVQGDDRLPALPSTGGYDPATMARYTAEHGAPPPDDHLDAAWLRWRADILTEFLAELRRRVKAIDPNLLVSMSPSPYDWSLREYLQDSKSWVARGLVDALHPQDYRYNLDAYKSTLQQTISTSFDAVSLPLLAPGILAKVGKYRIDADLLLQCIAFNRASGVRGESLFFYEGLREADGALARALREGPYAQPASVPQRDGVAWRPMGIVAQPERLLGEASAWSELESAPGVFAATSTAAVESSERDLIVYNADIADSGIYNLYTRVPIDPANAKRAVYLLQGADRRTEVEFNQTLESNAGWSYLGSCPYEAGANEVCFATTGARVAAGGDPGRTLAGPVLLLIDRRAMRGR